MRGMFETVLRCAWGLILALPIGLTPAAARTGSAEITISALSTAPDLVTGGDALLELNGPQDADIRVNGLDVSSDLVRDGVSQKSRILVRNLRDGDNIVEVRGGGKAARLRLVNHSIAGPILSGPHQQPFLCETGEFKLPDGDTLGQPLDERCSAPTNVQYLYMSTKDGQLKPFDAAGEAPADLARTVTSKGRTADYIVRLETGVINRAIYQIAVLASPRDGKPRFDEPFGAWNGGLVYTFGGGCGAAYHQGRGTGGVINNPEIGNDALAEGYALASATLNVLGANCNDVTSAETAVMVKEHFVEQFGPPRHTIGLGGSGGSMQQNLIAANYPGILDGLIPGRSFPDTLSMLASASDCTLLQQYFEHSSRGWTEEQKAAVAGYPQFAHCTKAWANYLPRWISPLGTGCDATAFITPQEGGALASTRSAAKIDLYDPDKNPGGVRCSYFDNSINVWGRRPDGASRRPLDNVGVQYGLTALNRGLIGFDDFVDLNRAIGGFDQDARPVAARTVADPEALRLAYETGRVNQGKGMNLIPIIDVRSYVDANEPTDVHMAYTTAVARARWARANGSTANMVSWTVPSTGSLRGDLTDARSPLRERMRQALEAMDSWLTNIESDGSRKARPAKVVAARPQDVFDACWDEKNDPVSRATPAGFRQCETLYPDHSDSRIAAGEPLERLALKCALKPVSASDYAARPDAKQMAILKAIFPSGVCDYSRPPQGQRPLAGVWIRFGPDAGSYVPGRKY